MWDIIQWFIHVLDFINKLAPIGLIITFIAFIKQMKDSKKADKERERTHVLEGIYKFKIIIKESQKEIENINIPNINIDKKADILYRYLDEITSYYIFKDIVIPKIELLMKDKKDDIKYVTDYISFNEELIEQLKSVKRPHNYSDIFNSNIIMNLDILNKMFLDKYCVLNKGSVYVQQLKNSGSVSLECGELTVDDINEDIIKILSYLKKLYTELVLLEENIINTKL